MKTFDQRIEDTRIKDQARRNRLRLAAWKLRWYQHQQRVLMGKI